MPVAADAVRSLVMSDLDDQGIVFDDDLFLRQLSRAQQWVCLRLQLLRVTVPISILPLVPFYAVSTVASRLVIVTHVQRGDGTNVWPVAFANLRYADTAWIQTPGTPRHFYRIGWRFLGVYPVPVVADTFRVTGLVLPGRLTAMTDLLEIPDAFVPQVVLLVAGLLTVSQERRIAEGLERIRAALGLAPPKAQAVSVVPTEPTEVR